LDLIYYLLTATIKTATREDIRHCIAYVLRRKMAWFGDSRLQSVKVWEELSPTRKALRRVCCTKCEARWIRNPPSEKRKGRYRDRYRKA